MAVAQAQSPAVRLAESQVDLARAYRVGADLVVRENPILSLSGGPRRLTTGDWVPDVILSVNWPVDVANSRGPRVAAVQAAIAAAEAKADRASRLARIDAERAWTGVLAARERLALERVRVEIEESTVRIARVRRTQGVSGDEELATAEVSLVSARARALTAEGEVRAKIEELRGTLGGTDASAFEVTGSLEGAALPALEELIRGLDELPDVQIANREIELARSEIQLQRRLAYPIPRFGIGLGRENEYYGRVSFDIALPVYQRNQTGIAVAQSQANVAGVARGVVRVRAETELRAAYARYEAARSSLELLTSALPRAADAEHLALRAFELGQRDLAATLLAVRESAALRLAQYEARVALALARLSVEQAAGGIEP